MAEPKRIGGQGAALDVNLVTPRGVVAHDATDGLTAPGEEGEFEVLPGHVPFLTALRPGVLTIGDRTRARYAVSHCRGCRYSVTPPPRAYVDM